jgi:ArsR family transcriptional regulator
MFQIMKTAHKSAIQKSPADFRKSADVFKALSNPNRLLIIDALGRGEHCVADLTKIVGLDMSTVSNHLAVLRGVGLVVDERRGTQVFYSLRSPCVLQIFECIEDFRNKAR